MDFSSVRQTGTLGSPRRRAGVFGPLSYPADHSESAGVIGSPPLIYARSLTTFEAGRTVVFRLSAPSFPLSWRSSMRSRREPPIWVPWQPTPLTSGSSRFDGIVGSLAAVKFTEGSHPLRVWDTELWQHCPVTLRLSRSPEGAHPLRTWAIYRC